MRKLPRQVLQPAATCVWLAVFVSAAIGTPVAQPVSEEGDLIPVAVFDSPTTAAEWRAVNDNVMGGRSSGGPRYGDRELIFSGSINTDGGGFSSIRAPLQPGILAGANGLKLRVRPDGRRYRVTLRSDVRYRGVEIAYRADIDAPQPGEWSDSIVMFEDLVPAVFGRTVAAPDFEPANATSIGIIISDGVDGPFELAVKSIHAGVF